jgi:hypothetical protein
MLAHETEHTQKTSAHYARLTQHCDEKSNIFFCNVTIEDSLWKEMNLCSHKSLSSKSSKEDT